jgi:hypothetical protein
MDDLFYFSKSLIHLQDVEQIAVIAGYQCEVKSDANGVWLTVCEQGQTLWQWSELREDVGDFNGFDLPQLDRIREYQPSAAFIVAHHLDSWQRLIDFLKLILSRFDGWIGCDDGAFEVIYTLDNIDRLPRLRAGRRPLDGLFSAPNENLFTPTTYREFVERYQAVNRENASLSYTNPLHRERKEHLQHLLLADMPREYRARLPFYLLARCPICGGRVAEAIDTYSLNGLGWIGSGNAGFGWYGLLGHPSHPSYEAECEHVKVMALAVNLNGWQPEDVLQEVWIGPEKPFVMLPLIKIDQTFAVIHALQVGNYNNLAAHLPYTVYFITYFTGNVTAFNEVIGRFDQDRSRVQIGTADYDLTKWVEAGKLFWLDPNDPALPLRNRPAEEFPYGGVEGLEGICVIRDGQLKLYIGPRHQRVRGQPQSGGILRRFMRKFKS